MQRNWNCHIKWALIVKMLVPQHIDFCTPPNSLFPNLHNETSRKEKLAIAPLFAYLKKKVQCSLHRAIFSIPNKSPPFSIRKGAACSLFKAHILLPRNVPLPIDRKRAAAPPQPGDQRLHMKHSHSIGAVKVLSRKLWDEGNQYLRYGMNAKWVRTCRRVLVWFTTYCVDQHPIQNAKNILHSAGKEESSPINLTKKGKTSLQRASVKWHCQCIPLKHMLFFKNTQYVDCTEGKWTTAVRIVLPKAVITFLCKTFMSGNKTPGAGISKKNLECLLNFLLRNFLCFPFLTPA